MIARTYGEVIDTLRTVRDAEPELAADALADATAEAMGLPVRKVRVAVRYYAAYRAEVDERIATNREEIAAEAEAAWRAEQNVLRGELRDRSPAAGYSPPRHRAGANHLR